MTNRLASLKTIDARLHRHLAALVALEKSGCWHPGIRMPHVNQVNALLARKAQLQAK